MQKLNQENRNSIILSERNWLAREIHGRMQQSLTGIMLHLEATMKLPELTHPHLRKRNGHFGLRNMRNRALLVGGQLTITSSSKTGTVVMSKRSTALSVNITRLSSLSSICSIYAGSTFLKLSVFCWHATNWNATIMNRITNILLWYDCIKS